MVEDESRLFMSMLAILSRAGRFVPQNSPLFLLHMPFAFKAFTSLYFLDLKMELCLIWLRFKRNINAARFQRCQHHIKLVQLKGVLWTVETYNPFSYLVVPGPALKHGSSSAADIW